MGPKAEERNDAPSCHGPDFPALQECAEKPVGMYFKLIHDKYVKFINEGLRELDLTYSQLLVLLELLKAEHEGYVLTQKELCCVCRVKHPTMIGLLQRLEEKSLVTKERGIRNRKFREIRLTDRARELLRQDLLQRREAEKLLLKGLSEEETGELRRLLAIVFENMMDI